MPGFQVYNGNPGDRFTNDTDKILWQFVCQFNNSCGRCIQWAGQVGPYWPIPLHNGCVCSQRPIPPGGQSAPFVDYQAEVQALDPHQQSRVMGAANYRMVQAGLVDWKDVVHRQRILNLREVAATKRLSVDQMVKAGVPKYQAERAYQVTHSPAITEAERKRAALLELLQAKGLSYEEIRAGVAKRLTARVGIAGGPSGPSGPLYPPSPPRPAPVRPPIVPRTPAQLTLPLSPVRPQVAPLPYTSKASASVSRYSSIEEVETATKNVLGRPLTTQELASLVGTPDEGRVILRTLGEYGLEIEASAVHYTMVRKLKSDAEGPYLYNTSFFIIGEQNRGQGLGLEIFGHEVDNAIALGINKIKTEGGRGPGMNGYYTWPRFGYDGDLPDGLPPRPPSLRHAKRVAELMETAEGRDWWREHGSTIHLEFDLKEGSLSRTVFDAYRDEKAKKPDGQ